HCTLDLAVGHPTFPNVFPHTALCRSSFGAATNFGVGASPVSVAVGDFTGDGTLDLAVANFGNNSVSILLNTCVLTCAAPSFAAATEFRVGVSALAVAGGDVNGDVKRES